MTTTSIYHFLREKTPLSPLRCFCYFLLILCKLKYSYTQKPARSVGTVGTVGTLGTVGNVGNVGNVGTVGTVGNVIFQNQLLNAMLGSYISLLSICT